MELQLVIHNIVSGISGVLMLGMAIPIYLSNRQSIANLTFSLVLVGGAIFTASHSIGVSIEDPNLSKNILMLNLVLFPLGALLLHSVLAFLKKNKEMGWLIVSAYLSATFLVIFFIINPNLFLLPSVSKMYFLNYYVAGDLNWTRLVFLWVMVFPYVLYILSQAHKKATSLSLRKQYEYLIFFIIGGLGTGFIANFLFYDIQIDPIFGMMFSFVCFVPFLYGAIRHNLFNIRVIATQALLYSISVVVVGSVLTILTYSGLWMISFYPNFPKWIIPLATSIVVVTTGFIVWWRLRENDILKYEFITTVTHKFRTPLTQIAWATDALRAGIVDEKNIEQVKKIQTAKTKMVGLINILTNLSEDEGSVNVYQIERNNISEMASKTVAVLKPQSDIKKIRLYVDIAPDIFVMCDSGKILFALQVLIENAIQYTNEKGSISVSLWREGGYAHLKIADSGIGIEKDELSRLFSKFYRTPAAQKADTEGMGIGLYLLKDIVSKHAGIISVDSDGIGRGSTFRLALKTA